MASHIVGYPYMGPNLELKFALDSFWNGKSSAEDLKKVAAELRSSVWKQMEDAGIKYIPSNTFSYYDHMLDTTAMLGAVPPRYGWNGGEIGFDVYFSMARGNASVPAMEKTNWFHANYHYIVPELGPEVKFSYTSHKAVEEYKEAKALGVNTVPVLVGPVSYLLLSKTAKGVEKSFSLLSLLPKILPIYKEVVFELKAAGASWIQFDEPSFVDGRESQQLEAFTAVYSELESTLSGLNVVVETYFADLTSAAYNTLTSLKGVTGFGFDLIRGTKTIELIKAGFPSGKYLFAGVVDGRNTWANDLVASIAALESLECVVGKDKLVVSTSCPLLHTAVYLVNQTEVDDEKSWPAFAAQKVVQVTALAKAFAGHDDEAFFLANATGQAWRRSSPRVNNADVTVAVKDSDLEGLRRMVGTYNPDVGARYTSERVKVLLRRVISLAGESAPTSDDIPLLLQTAIPLAEVCLDELQNDVDELSKSMDKRAQQLVDAKASVESLKMKFTKSLFKEYDEVGRSGALPNQVPSKTITGRRLQAKLEKKCEITLLEAKLGCLNKIPHVAFYHSLA